MRNFKQQVDKIQDSNQSKDVAKLQLLNKVIQDVEDRDDMEKATQMLARYNLEGERPTEFFCAMMRKCRKTAQVCTLVWTVVDKCRIETEEVLNKQANIED